MVPVPLRLSVPPAALNVIDWAPNELVPAASPAVPEALGGMVTCAL